MRNLNCVLFVLGLICCTSQVCAQDTPVVEEQKMPREIPSPEKIAQRETERLKDALDLTEKQYKKVYKLLLKEQRELLENRMPHPPIMNGHPGDGFFPPQGGGMPPMGEGRPANREGVRMSRPPLPIDGFKRENPEEMQKRIKKKNKKMKKILTAAQYSQWLSMSNEPVPFPGEKEPEH